ncbi:MAG: hypothetical protein JNK12_25265 [Acidimicrobiales bacterium]|nr:hypothetical protein [Acidimicrobiales bacterium]
MFDGLVVDELTMEMLFAIPSGHPYSEVGRTYYALEAEGFITRANYDSLIQPHVEAIKRITRAEALDLGPWLTATRESVSLWQDWIGAYSKRAARGSDEHMFNGFLPSNDEPSASTHLIPDAPPGLTVGILSEAVANAVHHGALLDLPLHHEEVQWPDSYGVEDGALDVWRLVTTYLQLVNANIILAAETNTVVHDWPDFAPFYEKKFEMAPDSVLMQRSAEVCGRVLEITFPEYRLESAKQFLAIVKDPRVKELRGFVAEAVANNDTVDADLGRRVLFEALTAELRLGRLRRLVSVASAPLSFIPFVGNPAQLAATELLDRIASRRAPREHKWVLMVQKYLSGKASRSL